jgi:hypothetical protein
MFQITYINVSPLIIASAVNSPNKHTLMMGVFRSFFAVATTEEK